MPERANLLKQLFQASQHFMTASYIPAAWATLRRWQQTVECQGPLITAREFELIDLALDTMTQQLRDKNRELERRRPPNQRDYGHAHNQALNAEVDRLRSSRRRLESLRWRRLDVRDVYGSHADSTGLQPSVKRWLCHRENRKLAQIASIPAPLQDGAGRVQPLDIDSIV
jgi:hypothetical protein